MFSVSSKAVFGGGSLESLKPHWIWLTLVSQLCAKLMYCSSVFSLILVIVMWTPNRAKNNILLRHLVDFFFFFPAYTETNIPFDFGGKMLCISFWHWLTTVIAPMWQFVKRSHDLLGSHGFSHCIGSPASADYCCSAHNFKKKQCRGTQSFLYQWDQCCIRSYSREVDEVFWKTLFLPVMSCLAGWMGDSVLDSCQSWCFLLNLCFASVIFISDFLFNFRASSPVLIQVLVSVVRLPFERQSFHRLPGVLSTCKDISRLLVFNSNFCFKV